MKNSLLSIVILATLAVAGCAPKWIAPAGLSQGEIDERWFQCQYEAQRYTPTSVYPITGDFQVNAAIAAREYQLTNSCLLARGFRREQ
jgi:hypothetical protein